MKFDSQGGVREVCFTTLFALFYLAKGFYKALSAIRHILVLAAIPVLGTGCVGIMADSITKSIATEGKFQDVVTTLPQRPPDTGRLFIYRTRSSTSHSLVIGLGITKNPTVCTVNDDVFEILWETFRYVDLPIGEHDVTAGADIFRRRGKLGKGSNRLQLDVRVSGDIFIRIDATGDEKKFRPVIVDENQAKAEIASLPFQPHGRRHAYFKPRKVTEP